MSKEVKYSKAHHRSLLDWNRSPTAPPWCAHRRGGRGTCIIESRNAPKINNTICNHGYARDKTKIHVYMRPKNRTHAHICAVKHSYTRHNPTDEFHCGGRKSHQYFGTRNLKTFGKQWTQKVLTTAKYLFSVLQGFDYQEIPIFCIAANTHRMRLFFMP